MRRREYVNPQFKSMETRLIGVIAEVYGMRPDNLREELAAACYEEKPRTDQEQFLVSMQEISLSVGLQLMLNKKRMHNHSVEDNVFIKAKDLLNEIMEKCYGLYPEALEIRYRNRLDPEQISKAVQLAIRFELYTSYLMQHLVFIQQAGKMVESMLAVNNYGRTSTNTES